MKNNIAIITARGGSKRIPRKNIKLFLGNPIIQYSIKAAVESKIFDEVMVSTDDEEIAEIALKAGATIPFFRSEANSNDYSTTADVILEVLEGYRQMGRSFQFACCIYPTAPFITPEKLNLAYKLLNENGADCVMPITKYSVPIWWALKLENNIISFQWPENELKRSQDLPSAYYDSGQFYFLDVKKFFLSKRIFSKSTMGIEVPESEVQDIDNEEDWKLAEIKYSRLYGNLNNEL